MTLPFPQTIPAGSGKTRKLETNLKFQNYSIVLSGFQAPWFGPNGATSCTVEGKHLSFQ